VQEPEAEVITALVDGPAIASRIPKATEVPTSRAGIYTRWDEGRQLVYVGVAGGNPQGARARQSAAQSRQRSARGEQFCVCALTTMYWRTDARAGRGHLCRW
jgi:hypothetical protein